MSKFPERSTWGQAFLLWLYTNVGGITGVWLTITVRAVRENNWSSRDDMGIILTIIGLVAAVTSLAVIPIAFVAFRSLQTIRDYWHRLLRTCAVITSLFTVLVVLAASFLMGSSFSLPSIMCIGGWAYLLAALVSAALVYQQALFRPNSPGDSADTPAA